MIFRAGYAAYLVFVGYLVFTPGGGAPGGAISLTLELLEPLGLHPTSALVEVGLNVVLILPLSLFGWFLFDRPSVPFWVVAGATTSIAIELAQLLIPGRVTSFRDVVANTLGATIGALVALALATWGKRGRSGVQDASSRSRSTPHP